MNVGSACTGVGGLDLGLERAGMRIVWQCEADEKCREVLARHWPDIPCHPDLRSLHASPDPAERRNGGGGLRGAAGDRCPARSDGQQGAFGPVGLFCGGSPCQDLSISGLRAGLAGERSSLFFDLVRVADAVLGPGGWFLFENVPGLLSSNRGRDFAVVLATLGGLGFHDLAWRVLDSRYFGVPQRRRRVFLVARRARGSSSAQVLLEPEGGGGDFAPGNQAGASVASTLSSGAGRPGVSAAGRRQEDDHNIVGTLDTEGGGVDDNNARAGQIVGPIMANGWRGDDAEAGGGHFVPSEIGTLRSGGHSIGLDTPERYPLVASTLATNPRGGGSNGYTQARDLIANTLTAEGHDASEDGTGRQTFVEAIDADGEGAPSGIPGRLDDPLRAVSCPVEPRPDAPRERQMGNAVTVPVAYWIGRRLMAHLETTEMPEATEAAA